MNKTKLFSLIFLVICVSTGVFSACKKEEQAVLTTTTSAQTSTTESNGYTYNEDFILTDETHTQYVHVVPPVPTRKPKETTKKSEETKAPVEITTKKSSAGNVNEESNGLHILSKTSPVIKGNSASVMIMGTPDAEYTIEFYETETKKAAYSGLENEKADSNGIANWTFIIENTCESGEKKVIIREKNSDKYIYTSITIV